MHEQHEEIRSTLAEPQDRSLSRQSALTSNNDVEVMRSEHVRGSHGDALGERNAEVQEPLDMRVRAMKGSMKSTCSVCCTLAEPFRALVMNTTHSEQNARQDRHTCKGAQ